MKFVSSAISLLLAANAKEISVPLTRRENTGSFMSKKVSNVMELAAFSKDITWAPDYIGHIWIGTPGQQQDIVFDSGSGMLIVATDNCTQCAPVKNSQGYYDEYYPSKSTTAKPSPYECLQGEQSAGCPQITYGSAVVETVRMSDKVCFNGVLGQETFATSTSECIEDYPVFAITQAKGITGGILGLTPACGYLAPECTPYIQTLHQQGVISEPIISFNLGQDSNWLKSMTASLKIGGMDEQYISGKMHSLKGYTKDYWAPEANGMKYDGETIDEVTVPTQEELNAGTYKMAVMDTGTSLMALSQDLVNKLLPKFQSAAEAAGCQHEYQGMFYMGCGCEKVASHFKDFDFIINRNIQITMSPYAYLQETQGYCYVAIQGMPSSVSGMNMYLLGDTFLRHFYTVFDYETNYVKLALNSQYAKDGYAESFLQTSGVSSLRKFDDEGSKWTVPNAYVVAIKEIEPVDKDNSTMKLVIAFSATGGLVVLGLVALFFYKRSEMQKRAMSKDMRQIKDRAAKGFEGSLDESAQQNLVAQE